MSRFPHFFSPHTAELILLLVSFVFAAGYLFVGLTRVAYPYDLDFIEDAVVLQAWRMAENQPIFLPANADFVPQVYTPLYFWLGSLLLRLTGPLLWPLRLISLGSTLATAVLLTFIALRIQSSRIIAFSCAALFLAGYRLTGGWYELARVDALFVALILAGMAVAVYGHQTSVGVAGAGIILALSVLTKQNGLFCVLVVGGYLLLVRPKQVWIYILAFLTVATIPLFYWQWSTEGLFSYYVVDVAYASPVELRRIWSTIWREFGGGMGLLVLMAGTTAVFPLRRRDWGYFVQSPWLIFMGTAIFVSIAGHSSVGGNLNNLILGFSLLCLSPALLAAEFQHMNRQTSLSQWVLSAAILAQFILLFAPPLPYAPTQFQPTQEMRLQGDRLLAYLTAVDGEVLVMLHPYYALLAGKEPDVHIQSLWHARHRGQDPLPPDLVTRIEQQHYQVIISDESPYFETEPALVNLLERYYQREPFDMSLSPPTLSGLTVRPLVIYTPK